MSRRTVYDIDRNRSRYAAEADVLDTRAAHVISRLRSRFDIRVGFGTYLKLSEICGRATSAWLRREGNRYVLGPDCGLGSESNPKYSVILVIQGRKIRAVYDAYDMMLLTVVPFEFKLHQRVVITDCCAILTEDGRHRILEDVR